MQKNNDSEAGFLRPRLFCAVSFCLIGALLGLLSWAAPLPFDSASTGKQLAQSSAATKHSLVQNLLLAFWRPAASPAAPDTVRRGVTRASATSPHKSPAIAGSTLTPVVGEAVSAVLSLPVRDLPSVSPFTISSGQGEERELSNRGSEGPANPLEHDPVIQSTTAPTVGMPSVGVSFDGLNNSQACNGCIPPDPNGAVGPNHYVQMVNEHFAIYSKTGTLLVGPKAINTLWSVTPNSTCATHNNGDPIVIYDQLADRWLLSQFTVQTGTENYAECIAISQTPDPTGAYYLYQFDESADTFHDYPHIGIWPDGYYMTTNLFPNDALLFSTGAGAWAFERPKMLLGQPARYVYFDETPLATETYTPAGQLPTSVEGKALPPAGTPNYFVEVDNTNTPDDPPAASLHDEMHIWQFHVDWTNPTASTFGTGSSAPAPKPGFTGQYAGNAGQPNFIIPIADYVPVPCLYADGPNCVPQKQSPPNQPEYLDVLGDRLMYRVTYRNFGDHESLVVSHTALGPADQPGGIARAGVRWYELRSVSSTPTVYQQSTFAPLDPTSLDGPLWRWMGSAAMDHSGDIAIGYSASGPNYFPSLHYAGRLVGDPLNELTQGEAVLFQGLGIEVAVPNYLQRNRWGDYSNLTVDPTDDCTFWYTNEYCPVNGPLDGISTVEWRTRVGSFRFPQCVPPGPPSLVSIASRKAHGGEAGTFDVNLPLPPDGIGIECRTGGGTGDHTVVVTFALPVTVSGNGSVKAQVTSGTGQVGSGGTADGNAVTVSGAVVTIPLTNVANAQRLGITLYGVSDGTNSGDVVIPMGVLLGDTNADGAVNVADIGQTKSQSGHVVEVSNFREDVNIDGSLNVADIGLVKSKSGTALP